ncbi:uncharacterized protein LOC130262786 [Oenanthe melanoleuca]|uniref:uncharacterized protein LOC130262786 n=1 Tax=Oenanthe melanoleuca TaxID=2939378 RepID=UPI0024C18BC4|nr:uncharacterized protein LOC130262786 [Oenanthe melanoleuca]
MAGGAAEKTDAFVRSGGALTAPHQGWRLSRKGFLPAPKMETKSDSLLMPHQRWRLGAPRLVLPAGGITRMRLGKGKMAARKDRAASIRLNERGAGADPALSARFSDVRKRVVGPAEPGAASRMQFRRSNVAQIPVMGRGWKKLDFRQEAMDYAPEKELLNMKGISEK